MSVRVIMVLDSLPSLAGWLYSSHKSLFSTALPPCAGWLPCVDCVDPNAAYMLCASRGFWWNPPKVLGDVVPVGKNPKVGEEGAEK